jgi:hypothetical protein
MNPGDELVVGHILLGQVADTAARNAVAQFVPQRAFHPINTVVSVLRPVPNPALPSYDFLGIARRCAAVVANSEGKAEELFWRQGPDVAPSLRSALIGEFVEHSYSTAIVQKLFFLARWERDGSVRDVGEFEGVALAGSQGLEPRYARPERAVLPLNDEPIDYFPIINTQRF